MIARAFLGAALAIVVAGVARRAGSLSAGGARAAAVVGTCTALAGWAWAILLIVWFAASSALTRLGRTRKVARVRGVVADPLARDAWQVAANGGVFAAAALAGTLAGDARWHLAALGALAAAAADTWATEIGTLWGGTPRSILTGRALAVGASGGVTVTGTAASTVAATLVALAAPLLLPATAFGSGPFLAVLCGGLAGSLLDSMLGASLQARRRCAGCGTLTERAVHGCGAPTAHAHGLRWMTNDTVNLLAALGGALSTLALAASLDRSFR